MLEEGGGSSWGRPTMKEVMDQQISSLTVIVEHLTNHLMHHNHCQITILLGGGVTHLTLQVRPQGIKGSNFSRKGGMQRYHNLI